MQDIWLIIALSILGPVIGSIIGVYKVPTKHFLYVLISFTAGVMITLSFLQLFPQGIALSTPLIAIAGFLLGCLFMYLLDKLLPHIHPELCRQEQGGHLKKTALFLFIGIFIHHLPEGLAMGIGSVTSTKLALIIAISLAIHDIPEAMATSAPYYYFSKKRLKSFLLSASTAIPTIIGILLAHFLLPFFPPHLVGMVIAATAGVMIYISFDELIPSSYPQLTNHSAIFSFIAGVVAVMLLSSL